MAAVTALRANTAVSHTTRLLRDPDDGSRLERDGHGPLSRAQRTLRAVEDLVLHCVVTPTLYADLRAAAIASTTYVAVIFHRGGRALRDKTTTSVEITREPAAHAGNTQHGGRRDVVAMVDMRARVRDRSAYTRCEQLQAALRCVLDDTTRVTLLFEYALRARKTVFIDRELLFDSANARLYSHAANVVSVLHGRTGLFASALDVAFHLQERAVAAAAAPDTGPGALTAPGHGSLEGDCVAAEAAGLLSQVCDDADDGGGGAGGGGGTAAGRAGVGQTRTSDLEWDSEALQRRLALLPGVAADCAPLRDMM